MGLYMSSSFDLLASCGPVIAETLHRRSRVRASDTPLWPSRERTCCFDLRSYREKFFVSIGVPAGRCALGPMKEPEAHSGCFRRRLAGAVVNAAALIE